ncbi:MAG: glycosyltransferase family 4 protein [Thermoguttaceae bacterium]
MNHRILHFVSALETSESGRQLLQLLDGWGPDILNRFPHKICVLGPIGQQVRRLREKGISVESVQKISPFDFMFRRRLATIVRHFSPNLIHVWDAGQQFAALKTALSASEARVIVEVNGTDCQEGHFRQVIRRVIKRGRRQQVDFVLSNDYFSSQLVQLGVPKNQISVIPPSIAPSPTSSWSRAELVAQLVGAANPPKTVVDSESLETVQFPPRQESGPFLIGLLGELGPGNRIKDAIWAANTMNVAGCDFHLLIFGDGPDRERLLRYRDALRLTDRIHFWGNRLNRNDFIPHFDLLWCMNTIESTSSSLFEAIAAKVPVLAVDHAVHRDWIEPEKTGVLVPDFGEDFRRRRSQFVEQTFRLFGNPELRRNLGHTAFEEMRQTFSPGQRIQRYIELLECREQGLENRG